MKDFYYILGTEQNCTSIEIREAYIKLSKKFHPDLNGNDYYFENQFKEIREAYETLNDPAKRSKYDASLKKFKTSPAEKTPAKRSYTKATKSIDIVFSLMLVLITGVFGSYVYKAMYSTKTAKTVKTAVAAAPVAVVHHKKKHIVKAPAVSEPPTVVKQVNEPVEAVKEVTQPKVIAKAELKPEKVTAPIINKPIVAAVAPVAINSAPVIPVNNVKRNTSGVNNAPSTGYIRANATGVVYMRSTDNYSADVVSVLPNNAQVSVLEQGNTFYKVIYNNKTGYVPKWTVKQ